MQKLNTRQFHWFLTLVGILFFIPFLGGVHLFDWDEINFAESAREMLVTGNYWQVQINFEPFWEKPPLFLWLQALSMKVFGVNEFAARLPNALVGIVSLNILFYFGRKMRKETVARWWAILYLVCFTPHFYFHTGIIDPLFNLWIFLSILQLYRALKSRKMSNWLFSGLFLGLAILTKGPVAGLIVGLVIIAYWIRNGFRFWFNVMHLVSFSIVTLAVASIWFLPEIISNGAGFISNFMAYQVDLMKNPVASHGQPWFYHAVVLLIGCFPASILALSQFTKSTHHRSFEFWMKAMFWIVLLLFSVVTTKIVHYSSLCYFPLTYLAATRMQWFEEGKLFTWFERFSLKAVGLLWMALFLLIPVVGLYRNEILSKFPNAIADSFTMGNLQAPVNWSILDVGIGLLSIVIFIWAWRSVLANKRLNIVRSLVALSAYFVLFIAVIVPKVEGHTQGSIVSFYEDLEGEDCYIDVYKFKSYAHYFYTKIQPVSESDALYEIRHDILNSLGVQTRIELTEEGRKLYSNQEMQWFLNGDIDKPVYLVCLPRKAQELSKTRGFIKVFEQGGHLVFKRNVGD